MDSDALFVKPLTRFLPEQDSKGKVHIDWDVALTAYDRDFVAPWADNASQVGMTKKGFVRVNCGVFLVNLGDLLLVRRFLNRWAHVSELLFTSGRHRPEPDHDVENVAGRADR